MCWSEVIMLLLIDKMLYLYLYRPFGARRCLVQAMQQVTGEAPSLINRINQF